MITAPTNPLLQLVRRLQRKPRERRQQRRFVAEGVHLAEEALRARYLPERVLLAENAVPEARQLAARFRREAVPVVSLSSRAFRSISDTETPQGILLLLPMRALPLPERMDLVLVVDGVRDPGNLGTILRTALAGGAQALLVPPGNVDPYNPKVLRAAMGAHFWLPLRQWDWADIGECLRGLTVFLAEARRGISCYQADLRVPLALIIGGEAGGAGEAARRLSDQSLHIPMPGPAESLNAAVAAAVLLFEAVRQRTAGHPDRPATTPAHLR